MFCRLNVEPSKTSHLGEKGCMNVRFVTVTWPATNTLRNAHVRVGHFSTPTDDRSWLLSCGRLNLEDRCMVGTAPVDYTATSSYKNFTPALPIRAPFAIEHIRSAALRTKTRLVISSTAICTRSHYYYCGYPLLRMAEKKWKRTHSAHSVHSKLARAHV